MVKLVARTFDQVRVEYSCHSGRIHMCWCCQTGDRVGFAGNGVGAAAGRRPIAADLRDRHGILTTGTCQYFKFVAFSVDFIILTERTEVPDDFRNYNNLQPNMSIAREALL